MPDISGSFNMDKIISENNKKLNRYGYDNFSKIRAD